MRLYGVPAVLAVTLVGCLSDKTKSADPPAVCVKAGETCTFAPGKLGLCIVPVNGGPPICQSQH